jgi:hypothetical protein
VVVVVEVFIAVLPPLEVRVAVLLEPHPEILVVLETRPVLLQVKALLVEVHLLVILIIFLVAGAVREALAFL